MLSGGPTPRIATRLPPVCLLGMAWPQCGKTDAPHPAAATASPPVHPGFLIWLVCQFCSNIRADAARRGVTAPPIAAGCNCWVRGARRVWGEPVAIQLPPEAQIRFAVRLN